MIGILCMLALALVIGQRLKKKKVDLGIFSIGIDYFQVHTFFVVVLK